MRPFTPWIRNPYVQAVIFHMGFAALLYHNILIDPPDLLLGGQQVGGYLTWHYSHWAKAVAGATPFFHSNLVMAPTGVPMFFISPLNEILAVLFQLVLPITSTVNAIAILAHIATGFGAFVFLYSITDDKLASTCGSVAYAYSAFSVTQHLLGQFDQSNLIFNPLLCWAITVYYRKPNSKNATLVALMLAGVFLQGAYAAFSFGFIFLLGGFIFLMATNRNKFINKTLWTPLLIPMLIPLAVGIISYSPVLLLPKQVGGAGEFYSTYLASFIDLPYWHTANSVQNLRILNGSPIEAENLMGYLGIGFFLALIIGWRQGLFRTTTGRFWLWMLLFSAALSLGPTLKFAPGQPSSFPLPYAIFQHLPVLEGLRNSGRIVMTTSLAASVITALVLALLWKNRTTLAWIGTVLFVGLFWLEFDLPYLSRRVLPSHIPSVYTTVKNETGEHLLLELPQYYNPGMTLFIPSQQFMYYQTYHQKPMLLGCPSRYSQEALNLTENTPFLYELTHPKALIKLYEDPGLKDRRDQLAAEGRDILKAQGIKFVTYHLNYPVYDDRVHRYCFPWIIKALGTPISRDGDVFLFQVF